MEMKHKRNEIHRQSVLKNSAQSSRAGWPKINNTQKKKQQKKMKKMKLTNMMRIQTPRLACWKGLQTVSLHLSPTPTGSLWLPPNRFRINLCAPFSEIWARRVHDICLDSKSCDMGGSWGLAGFRVFHPSICTKLNTRRVKQISFSVLSQTIIPCTNSFAALLSLAINTPSDEWKSDFW